MRYQADPDLEFWVLYELTEKPEGWDLAALDVEDFTNMHARQWFELLAERQQDGKPYVGLDELVDVLRNDRNGEELCAEITRRLVSTWHWEVGHDRLAYRANQLRTYRYRRELAASGQRIIDRAGVPGEGEQALQDEMDFLAVLRDRIGAEIGTQEHLKLFREHLTTSRQPLYWERQDKRMKGGIPSRGGVLTVIARPSVGKTTYLLQSCRNIARNNPQDFVAVVSLEMSHQECVERLLMSHCRVDDIRLKEGMLRPGKVQWAGKHPDSFQDEYANLLVWDDLFTFEDIQQRAARVAGRIRLVVLDYVQLLHVPGRDEYQQITWVYRHAKKFAKSLDTAVVLACQITRAGRRDKCPKLEAGRGSGAIEEGSDIVMGLWRPNWDVEQNEERPDCDLRVTILKNRYGWCGTAPMRFYVPHQHLDEVPYGDAYQRQQFDDAELTVFD